MDETQMRYAILMRAFDSVSDPAQAMDLAHQMHSFIYNPISHEWEVDFTNLIGGDAPEFEGPVQGFDGVPILGKKDMDYAPGNGSKRVSTRENSRRRWTEAEVSEVKQYLANGFSLDDIAEAIGRSWMAVEKAVRDGRFA